MQVQVLKEIIANDGDSYTSLAKKLGITTASVSHKMAGQTPWKLDEIKKLRELYKLTMQDVETIFF